MDLSDWNKRTKNYHPEQKCMDREDLKKEKNMVDVWTILQELQHISLDNILTGVFPDLNIHLKATSHGQKPFWLIYLFINVFFVFVFFNIAHSVTRSGFVLIFCIASLWLPPQLIPAGLEIGLEFTFFVPPACTDMRGVLCRILKAWLIPV